MSHETEIRMARAENDTEGLTEPQRLWVEALRSGKYEQAEGVLCHLDEDGEPVGFCCLGVACEVAREAGVDVDVHAKTLRLSNGAGMRCRTYDHTEVTMPLSVQEWLGMANDNPGFPYAGSPGRRTLASLNDSGAVFDHIADVIESRPEGLFR